MASGIGGFLGSPGIAGVSPALLSGTKGNAGTERPSADQKVGVFRGQNCPNPSPAKRQAAFTLIEMIIVICIIMGLLSLVFGVALALHRRAARQATYQRTIIASNLCCDVKNKLNWPTIVGGRFLWDLNEDGLLDGEVDKDLTQANGGKSRAQGLTPPGQGFAKSTGYREKVDALGRPTDTYALPLRIAFSVEVYGKEGWGVWSAGPDGEDGTEDDICSWKSE